jgi:hypothetical protein
VIFEKAIPGLRKTPGQGDAFNHDGKLFLQEKVSINPVCSPSKCQTGFMVHWINGVVQKQNFYGLGLFLFGRLGICRDP